MTAVHSGLDMTDATRIDRWLADRRYRPRVLADPPPGSGLRPVVGDVGLPFLGHSLEMLRIGLPYVHSRHQEYGEVTWSRGFGANTVSAIGGDAVQEVLANKDKAFSQRGWEYFIGPFFRRGLMLLDFGEHLHHRRIMQQAFTRPRLSGYLGGIASLARQRIADWPAGEAFEVFPAVKTLSLDIATEVFMGHEGEDTVRLTDAFVDTVRAGTAILRAPVPGGRWWSGLRGREVLERYFRAEIPGKRAGAGEDLFSALCHSESEDGHTFTDDDVVNHMIFLMMAAHDTSTITTTAAMYYLALHPEWQDAVREESLAAGDEPLDVDGVESLRALDLVVREALRLVAPVPWLLRKTVADTQLCGYYVPADTLVTIYPGINHLLPEYWTHPEWFDPERFSEERREDKSHRYAWMPFGGGVHKCIGMMFGTLEVKTLLHELVRRYTWSVPPGYRVRWDPMALPRPVDGLPVRLRRR
ncbi:cytochrome P450 [Herbihabitans rhizosphaerae]|uniref:Cytochrome P450 n=1 Tax=Herbihabitans rhizosphaerae TaxID=1872711 RepID=A0A4Q7KJI2_9PSEU|nr:cytochrome P450 [Herbihabitans rhizosphaerae]RZS34405.1 cytochrome P450 [Herbihabitans rhizosphaerae]